MIVRKLNMIQENTDTQIKGMKKSVSDMNTKYYEGVGNH